MPVSELEITVVLGEIPREVRQMWLYERIQTAGWPPRGDRWRALLRWHTTNQWSQFTWAKEEIDLSAVTFSEDSMLMLQGLAEARFQRVKNSYYGIENSDERMTRILSHINETRRLPQSIVLIAGRSWKIVDGSHRLTAYRAYINSKQFKD